MKITKSFMKLLIGFAGVAALGVAAFFLFKFFVDGYPAGRWVSQTTVRSLGI